MADVIPDIIVIGGGAAGLAAAVTAKARGARVLLLERNEKLGKKLYITGKGRCNVCNLCTPEEFLRSVPRNPRFLHAALAHLTPEMLREWLRDMGCPTVVERGTRVYPESQKASDVTRAFAQRLSPGDVRLHARVASLDVEGGQVRGVRMENGGTLAAAKVIVATGGKSYPLTGSDGDGYRLAAEAGHTVTPLFPSLTGLETAEDWPKRLQGLSLRDVALEAQWAGKGRFREQGELLLTHFGISGPLTLKLSSYLSGTDLAQVQVWLDLKPALDGETLRARLNRDSAEKGRKRLATLLLEYMPASLAAEFPALAGVDGETRAGQLTGAQRQRLVATLKAIPLRVTRLRPFPEAVVTRGGVEVREVNPSTMESLLVRGLYFAGEVLDVDALTGGFNLQIAFSTGALAGAAAAGGKE